MHEDEAFLGGQLAREGARGVEPVALDQHAGAEMARALDLGEGRAHGHDDGRRNLEPARVVGNALGVVAGGHCHDPGFALLGREAEQLDQRAAVLEGARILLALQLEDDPLGPDQLGKARRIH
jgi:hypothetical protein